MNAQKKVFLAAAAMTGLLAGAAARASAAPVSSAPISGQATVSAASGHQMNALTGTPGARTLDDAAKHDCKGMNSCKGQGGCASSDNGCKGKNSCKGKGGCKTSG